MAIPLFVVTLVSFFCVIYCCPSGTLCPANVNQTVWACCPTSYTCVVLDAPLAGICVEGAPGTLLTEEEAPSAPPRRQPSRLEMEIERASCQIKGKNYANHSMESYYDFIKSPLNNVVGCLSIPGPSFIPQNEQL
jgi:hypothetical protein